MTTTVYLVRHAEPNYHNHDDFTRELTEQGLKDSLKVTAYLKDKGIDKVYSSPFRRAHDTVKDLAHHLNLPITLEDDFRERRIDSVWIEDFNHFAQKQWQDFSYKLSDGESLSEVQYRNISALEKIIAENPNKNLVIGSHGTALSTIVNHYQPDFDYSAFSQIKHLFPFIVKLTFSENICQSISFYNILKEPPHETSLL
ncbi:histidine phosphatase family protein [Streptococcus moroccensis]|uniref:2,3-bisphosphoglycerate-dependent phosphoglycerate mutase n=1 Tax=Streptococcus moroccensis TaxID=1451356 RepID=A0ABT9YRE0_9STRE|nr:histidine phosphatase family protein [Streptococcus moroccensis]MDQ0222566.1 2,3-bisphosphoglycerate-dependent phosphoglycerate mutase [Streptococcus moroccensis]